MRAGAHRSLARRRTCTRCRSSPPARPLAPWSTWSRHQRTNGNDVPPETMTPSAALPASSSICGPDAASMMGTARAALISRRRSILKTSPACSIASPASSPRQIAIASLMVRSGRAAAMPAPLRSVGAPTPSDRTMRPGNISSKVAAAMAATTGCGGVGADGEKAHANPARCRKGNRRQGDGIRAGTGGTQSTAFAHRRLRRPALVR